MISDLTRLEDINENNVTNALVERFHEDLVYTKVGPILIALNPFKAISGMYTHEMMDKCKNSVTLEFGGGDQKFASEEIPHVFTITSLAFQKLCEGQSQSLIISGESGAGKTETTKQALNFLTYVSGARIADIKEKLILASPILESWGNAKTLRNDNSSRFGKFTEVWFDSNGRNGDDSVIEERNLEISAATNTTYLLEKSRVVHQDENERSFHIFYQYLKGGHHYHSQHGTAEIAASIESSPFFQKSSQGTPCVRVSSIDDKSDFEHMLKAMTQLEFSTADQDCLLDMVAAILHLRGLNFLEPGSKDVDTTAPPPGSAVTLSSDVCSLHPNSTTAMGMTCGLLGVSVESLKQALFYRKVELGTSVHSRRKASLVFSPMSLEAVEETREALCKDLYSKCFDFIVHRINKVLDVQSRANQSNRMVGVLDIFGFEIFPKNSFEQLCINLANESLQQEFNVNIFRREMEMYHLEGVPVPSLSYRDNQDVLDLLLKKPQGIFPVLDEEGVIPRGNWQGFLTKITKYHGQGPTKNSRFFTRPLVQQFGINHYAGDVSYDPSQFLKKNKDMLPILVMEVMSDSSIEFVRDLFSSKFTDNSNSSSSNATSKLSLGKQFSIQLDSLLKKIHTTQSHYLRCIKTNSNKLPRQVDLPLVVSQLTCSGVFQAVSIMKSGYPFRKSLKEFRDRYHLFVYLDTLSSPRKLDAYKRIYPQSKLVMSSPSSENSSRHRRRSLTKVINHSQSTSKSTVVYSFQELLDGCREILQLAVESHVPDLKECFVGKSLVFYRSEQHRSLESTRAHVFELTCVRLQKVWRGSRRRYCYHWIKNNRKNIVQAVQSRDISKIKDLKVQFESHCQALTRYQRWHDEQYEETRISVKGWRVLDREQTFLDDFTEALENQVRWKSIIEEKLKETTEVNMAQQLVPLREAASNMKKVLHFDGKCFGVDIKLTWETNDALVEMSRKIDRLDTLVNMNRSLEACLKSGDEVRLEALAQEVELCIREGVISDPSLCKDVQRRANEFLKSVGRRFEEFLTYVRQGIMQGACRVSRSQASIVDKSTWVLRIDADPDLLESSMLNWAQSVEFDPACQKSRGRLKTVYHFFERLARLRRLAMNSDFASLWNILHGDFFVISSSLVDNSLESRSENSSENDVIARFFASPFTGMKSDWLPTDIKSSIESEFDHFRLLAVEGVPAVKLKEGLTSLGAISEQDLVLYTVWSTTERRFYQDRVAREVDELNLRLKKVELYSRSFDPYLANLCGQAKEISSIRLSVSQRNRVDLEKALNSLRYVDRSISADFQWAYKLFSYLTTLEHLISALVDQAPRGIVGELQYGSISTIFLNETLQEAKFLTWAGDPSWNLTMDLCKQIFEYRSLLSQTFGDLKTISTNTLGNPSNDPVGDILSLLEMWRDAEPWKDAPFSLWEPKKRAASSISSKSMLSSESCTSKNMTNVSISFESILKLSLEEFAQIFSDIHHKIALSAIQRAVNATIVEGTLGSLSLPDVFELDLLEGLLIEYQNDFLWSSSVYCKNLSDIAGIRQATLKCRWKEVKSRILGMWLTDSSTEKTVSHDHPAWQELWDVSFHEEIELLFVTSVDELSKESLLASLSQGSITETYFLLDNPAAEISGSSLRKALVELHREVPALSTLSQETQRLIFSLELLVLLRELVRLNQWEIIELENSLWSFDFGCASLSSMFQSYLDAVDNEAVPLTSKTSFSSYEEVDRILYCRKIFELVQNLEILFEDTRSQLKDVVEKEFFSDDSSFDARVKSFRIYDIFNYYEETRNYVSEECVDEFTLIGQVLLERKSRILLFFGCWSGRFVGPFDAIQTINVRLDLLESALTIVNGVASYHNPDFTVLPVWIPVANQLLLLRKQMTSLDLVTRAVTLDHSSSITSWFEVVDIHFLFSLQDSISDQIFPKDELNLWMKKSEDFCAIQELLHCFSVCGPQLVENRFMPNCFTNILEETIDRIEKDSKYALKSRCLESILNISTSKLIPIFEIIERNCWELSNLEEISLQRLLDGLVESLSQSKDIFPSQNLLWKKISIIKSEISKRQLFKRIKLELDDVSNGIPSGPHLELNFCRISCDALLQLQDELDSWGHSHDRIRDVDALKMHEVIDEVLNLRTRLLDLNSNYRRKMKLPTINGPEESALDLLGIEDTMKMSLFMVKQIRSKSSCRLLIEEWEEFRADLPTGDRYMEARASWSVIQGEWYCRKFFVDYQDIIRGNMDDILIYFSNLNGVQRTFSSGGESQGEKDIRSILSRLRMILDEFAVGMKRVLSQNPYFHSDIVPLQGFHRFNSILKASFFSLVFVVKLFEAFLGRHYEKVDRYWRKEDPSLKFWCNFEERLFVLNYSELIKTSLPFQSCLHSFSSFLSSPGMSVPDNVKSLFKYGERLVEIEVSLIELSIALESRSLSMSSQVGLRGIAPMQKNAKDAIASSTSVTLEQALKRIDELHFEVSFMGEDMKLLVQSCRLLNSLRGSISLGKYSEGFHSMKNYLIDHNILAETERTASCKEDKEDIFVKVTSCLSRGKGGTPASSTFVSTLPIHRRTSAEVLTLAFEACDGKWRQLLFASMREEPVKWDWGWYAIVHGSPDISSASSFQQISSFLRSLSRLPGGQSSLSYAAQSIGTHLLELREFLINVETEVQAMTTRESLFVSRSPIIDKISQDIDSGNESESERSIKSERSERSEGSRRRRMIDHHPEYRFWDSDRRSVARINQIRGDMQSLMGILEAVMEDCNNSQMEEFIDFIRQRTLLFQDYVTFFACFLELKSVLTRIQVAFEDEILRIVVDRNSLLSIVMEASAISSKRKEEMAAMNIQEASGGSSSSTSIVGNFGILFDIFLRMGVSLIDLLEGVIGKGDMNANAPWNDDKRDDDDDSRQLHDRYRHSEESYDIPLRMFEINTSCLQNLKILSFQWKEGVGELFFQTWFFSYDRVQLMASKFDSTWKEISLQNYMRRWIEGTSLQFFSKSLDDPSLLEFSWNGLNCKEFKLNRHVDLSEKLEELGFDASSSAISAATTTTSGSTTTTTSANQSDQFWSHDLDYLNAFLTFFSKLSMISEFGKKCQEWILCEIEILRAGISDRFDLVDEQRFKNLLLNPAFRLEVSSFPALLTYKFLSMRLRHVELFLLRLIAKIPHVEGWSRLSCRSAILATFEQEFQDWESFSHSYERASLSYIWLDSLPSSCCCRSKIKKLSMDNSPELFARRVYSEFKSVVERFFSSIDTLSGEYKTDVQSLLQNLQDLINYDAKVLIDNSSLDLLIKYFLDSFTNELQVHLLDRKAMSLFESGRLGFFGGHALVPPDATYGMYEIQQKIESQPIRLPILQQSWQFAVLFQEIFSCLSFYSKADRSEAENKNSVERCNRNQEELSELFLVLDAVLHKNTMRFESLVPSLETLVSSNSIFADDELLNPLSAHLQLWEEDWQQINLLDCNQSTRQHWYKLLHDNVARIIQYNAEFKLFYGHQDFSKWLEAISYRFRHSVVCESLQKMPWTGICDYDDAFENHNHYYVSSSQSLRSPASRKLCSLLGASTLSLSSFFDTFLPLRMELKSYFIQDLAAVANEVIYSYYLRYFKEILNPAVDITALRSSVLLSGQSEATYRFIETLKSLFLSFQCFERLSQYRNYSEKDLLLVLKKILLHHEPFWRHRNDFLLQFDQNALMYHFFPSKFDEMMAEYYELYELRRLQRVPMRKANDFNNDEVQYQERVEMNRKVGSVSQKLKDFQQKLHSNAQSLPAENVQRLDFASSLRLPEPSQDWNFSKHEIPENEDLRKILASPFRDYFHQEMGVATESKPLRAMKSRDTFQDGSDSSLASSISFSSKSVHQSRNRERTVAHVPLSNSLTGSGINLQAALLGSKSFGNTSSLRRNNSSSFK